MLEIIRSGVRTFIPRSVRTSKLWTKLRHAIVAHDRTYDASYFENEVETTAAASAGAMATSIMLHLQPKTVIDVGCGTGALLEALQKCGCEVRGLEYASAGVERCRLRSLNVSQFDITADSPEMGKYDLAMSFEVAEHLPAAYADRYVNLLCCLAPTVIISAAIPGQGGTDHVNEQPHSYWIEKFGKAGFLWDETTAQISKAWTEDGVASFYANNVMVFRKPG